MEPSVVEPAVMPLVVPEPTTGSTIEPTTGSTGPTTPAPLAPLAQPLQQPVAQAALPASESMVFAFNPLDAMALQDAGELSDDG